jgi:hypothetical protein
MIKQQQIGPTITGPERFLVFLYSTNYLQTSKLGNYKKVGDMMEGMPRTSSSPDVLEWIDKGGWAFIGDGTHLEYLANKWCEKYVIADETFHKFGYGYALPKGAPLNTVINRK